MVQFEIHSTRGRLGGGDGANSKKGQSQVSEGSFRKLVNQAIRWQAKFLERKKFFRNRIAQLLLFENSTS